MSSATISALRERLWNPKWGSSTLARNLQDMLIHNWYLGFTSFGGPAVHFQIFRKLFVEKLEWLDLQMYQELFALCQGLPGPGSTKMHFSINLIHGGFLTGLVSFFVWSLPGALAAYGLSLGISKMNDKLPDPVYALLSGLNSATVGIIALAAVQLSQKAITDKLTRVLVFLGGTAGMLYNALWYFPILMVAGGAATVIWDYKVFQNVVIRFKNRRQAAPPNDVDVEATQLEEIGPGAKSPTAENRESGSAARHRANVEQPESGTAAPGAQTGAVRAAETPAPMQTPDALRLPIFSWKLGSVILAGFFASFIVFMVLRGALHTDSRGFNLFTNLYLAGTIIFGGGPVVIPLLREYVVAEGWVSPRDFLLGLAIIQAYPGPNFNFAVYLGSLAALSSSSLPSAAGATIAFLAIFTPGLILHTGFMGLWRTLRRYRWFTSCLRGINATAVGLVYTAVYRLWEIGYLSKDNQDGSSLGGEPWWVVVTATSFVGGMWFGVSPPVAILLGGAMGMIWYGVVSA